MDTPAIALLDNGSLRPSATLALRRTATALTQRIGTPVAPVSLLHSSKVPAEDLGGIPADVFGGWVRRMAEAGRNDLVVLPYFLGPSQAVTGYLPERVEKLRTTMPGLRVRLGPVLAEATSDAEEQLAGVLEDRVRDVLARAGLPQAAVAVVDHGSPEPRVAAVRDSVATRLRHRLGGTAVAVEPCSMERREGPEYAFADPLLSALLGRPPFDRGDVVAAMMFLSPGRHAGPDGDVAQICQEAQNRLPDLRVTMTDLLGGHPAILELLAASFTTAIASKSL